MKAPAERAAWLSSSPFDIRNAPHDRNLSMSVAAPIAKPTKMLQPDLARARNPRLRNLFAATLRSNSNADIDKAKSLGLLPAHRVGLLSAYPRANGARGAQPLTLRARAYRQPGLNAVTSRNQRCSSPRSVRYSPDTLPALSMRTSHAHHARDCRQLHALALRDGWWLCDSGR